MEVFKTYLFFEDHDQGHPYLIDTIEHEGAWWLVASWLVANSTGERAPERLVRLTGLRFEEAGAPRYRFLLNNPIPKAVLDGETRDGYVSAVYSALSGTPAPTTKPH